MKSGSMLTAIQSKMKLLSLPHDGRRQRFWRELARTCYDREPDRLGLAIANSGRMQYANGLWVFESPSIADVLTALKTVDTLEVSLVAGEARSVYRFGESIEPADWIARSFCNWLDIDDVPRAFRA